MSRSRSRLVYLTGPISRAAGGLFEALRNMVLQIEDHHRYVPSVIGLEDPNFDLDRPLWGRIETRALRVRGPSSFGYAPDLHGILAAQNPDLLHVHGLWMYTSIAARRWSRCGRPYLVSPHGMLDPWALNHSRLKKRISAAIYENRHLRGAACLHSLNRAEAEAIRTYGLTNPVCVIPNGVTLPDSRRENTSRDSHTLLYLGRLHPKKGLSKLIQAWSNVQTKAKDAGWQLTIAGWDQNGHQSELETLAQKLHTGSNICFGGPKFGEWKNRSFQTASAFILPSYSEGLPMSVLEAWSWRLPVVMTPQCNLPEGADAGAAILTELDVDSLSAALIRLFSMSRREQLTMGEKGRRLVTEKFHWPRIVEQVTQVYDWILGLGPQPACVLK